MYILSKIDRILATPLIGALKIYKLTLSPLLGRNCRFYPSCSEYAAGALKEFGFFKGAFLSVKRIIRCHPFNPGGYDPVPDK